MGFEYFNEDSKGLLKDEDVKPLITEFSNCYENARGNGKIKTTELEDIFKSIDESNESVHQKTICLAFFGGPGSGKSKFEYLFHDRSLLSILFSQRYKHKLFNNWNV